MIKLEFFISTALGNLRRGGQRAWVALLCVAFGVMSLIAMSLLSESIARALLLAPAERFGADASISRQAEDTISPALIRELEGLKEEGLIDQMAPVATASDLIFRGASSGDYHAASGLGVDPSIYPLAGALTFEAPVNTGLAGLLGEPGDVILTRDLAEMARLKVGDAIVLSTLETGAPVEGRVRAVAADTPNHAGSKVYYNLQTAARLRPGQEVITVMLANSRRAGELEARLSGSGWWIMTGEGLALNDQSVLNLFDLLLKGAGILGMLVGGIGIANTMQVLLKRRQNEIAIWKTLGYTAGDLRTLFVIEAALLGLLGSLLGAGLGLLVSNQLVTAFSRTGNLLIRWQVIPSAPLILSSVLAGLLTTIIFALWAIVNASQVPPLTLLRGEPGAAFRQSWKQKLALALALAAPFTVLTSLVMGSALKGVGVLLFALAGLATLGSLLQAAAWVITRLLPFRGLPLARMARGSFRRGSRAQVFAMIALFTGVVTLTLGVVITQNASRVMSAKEIDLRGYNLGLLAPASQEATVTHALAEQNADRVLVGYQATIRSIQVQGQAEDLPVSPVLVGRPNGAYDYQVQGAPWGSAPDGVYAPSYSGIETGSEVVVTLLDGSTRTFHVMGTYSIDYASGSLPPKRGLLMSADLFKEIIPAESITVYARVKGMDPSTAAARLGQLLPEATVINLVAYAMRFTQAYHNLFVLALGMSGLALLAGALLVANSVSLAMLDRRYEIGILKSIGYSRRHVLSLLMMEYGLVAVVSSAAGLAGVGVFLQVMGMLNPLASSLLVLPPLEAFLIGAGCILLILLTVIAVTWETTRVSPLLILNDRG